MKRLLDLRVLVALLLALGIGPSGITADERTAGAAAEPAVRESAGALHLLLEVRRRETELARRERDVEQRERSVAALEAEAAQHLEDAERVRETLEQRLVAMEGQLEERVARLAKMVASMPPDRAASLLESLELELATDVLMRMKHKKSAAILAVLPEERAVALSRRVARPLSPPKVGTGPASAASEDLR